MADLSSYGQALIDFAMKKKDAVPKFYREAFLNYYGCVLSGYHSELVETAVKTFKKEGTSSYPPPVGRTEHLALPKTVQIDCLSSACLAYDDIQFETTLHPAGPVASAILGVARTQKVTGKEALQAFQAGMEVECRTALGFFGKNTPTSKCWYPTGVAGGMGGAVAAGQLLHLNRGQMESAIGLAAAYASGTRGTHGGMSGSWVPGIAAEAGYTSARLAENGFTAPISSLTGENGLFNAINPDAPYDKVFEGLGDRYVCETTACKPYPFGFISFAVIKCCLDMAEQLKKAGSPIDQVKLFLSPTSYDLGRNPTPLNMNQAMVSLRYITARILSDPQSAYVPLEDNFVIPGNVKELMEHVTLYEDKSLRNDQARLEIDLADGTKLSQRCDTAPGAPGNPLSTEEIEHKFVLQAEKALNKEAADKLLEMFRNFEDVEDISELITYPAKVLSETKKG